MGHVPGSIVDVCVHTRTQANATHMHVPVFLSSSSLVTECPEACSLAKVAWALEDKSS